MAMNSILGAALRRAGGAAALVSAVVAVSSCSSASGGAKSTAPSPPPTTATVTTSAAATTSRAETSPETSASPSTVASASAKSSSPGVSGCTNSHLAVTSKSLSGASSHNGLLIVFTNTSRQTCSLFGYPGAAVLDLKDKQIVQAKRTLEGYLGSCGCKTPEHIALKPGAAASAVVEGSNGGGDECLRGRAVLVTPPNTQKSTKFSFEDYSCDFQVHPVAAGTNARPPS